ncbi:uncharacterized protein K452DRAFT_299445 [Aplosporella prunicola CBS 121167]|uniref:F-box domain-containing protein n=1 Tax=Aplosporella prunicola CBS 121167 TaxID=1176127 RepID=A0A6A6B9L7_9PEZI|nr:uncharacterized protein K452DRAFT_299445 [Aplosporella prunicola CBS 121167]KAF2140726.1 hypothetical protein K452DRAFT_299445 [Aplosporella prunicola CBS 121167]
MPKRVAGRTPSSSEPVPKKNKVSPPARSVKKQTPTQSGRSKKARNSATKALNLTTRRATRSMTLERRTVFPFLRLPGELRNLIYSLTLNFNGTKKYLDIYFDSHTDGWHEKPIVHKETPSILLVNKQILRESLYILHRKKLTLSHGFIPYEHVSYIISPPLLANLREVDFTRDISSADNSHCWCDIMEFFHLINDCIDIWVEPHPDEPPVDYRNNPDSPNNMGHNLQYLNIDVRGNEIARHLEQCPPTGQCFFLDEIQQMLANCKRLRGIKKVTFGGFLAQYAQEAKKAMETPPCYLLRLPKDVRSRIWSYCADWNAVNAAITHDPTSRNTTSSTPSVLLLNTRISAEASAVLRAKPLMLTSPPQAEADLTKFMNPQTFCTVRHLEVHVDLSSLNTIDARAMSAAWKSYLGSLATLLQEKQSHSLDTLHIHLRSYNDVSARDPEDANTTNALMYAAIVELSGLADKTVGKGIREITFGGDVPVEVKHAFNNKQHKSGRKSNKREKGFAWVDVSNPGGVSASGWDGLLRRTRSSKRNGNKP